MEANTLTLQKKQSRAERYRERIKIRLAVDSCGPDIGKLLEANGTTIQGASWERIYPSWLIATDGDELIGCAQILPARPVGHIDFLCMSRKAPFKLRVIAMRKLLAQALETLKMGGADYACIAIIAANNQMINAAKKLGVQYGGEAQLLVKRVAVEH